MGGRQHFLHRINPLRCGGQRLPVQAVAASKLLVLYVVFSKAPGGSHTIAPFLEFFSHIPYPDEIRFLLKLGIAAASFLVFLNQFTKQALLYIGASCLIIILWSRLNYSNNQVFLALTLLMIGLHHRGSNFWGARITVGLLYFGAGLNKLLEPDWQTGQVMEFWLQEDMQVWWLGTFQAIWESPAIFSVIAWLVILTELTLAICFLIPGLLKRGIVLGLLFHSGMLVATGGVISHLFMYLMVSTYLLFVDWPAPGTWRIHAGRMWLFLKWMDFDKRFHWELKKGRWLNLIWVEGKDSITGFKAALNILVHSPFILLSFGFIYVLFIFGWP